MANRFDCAYRDRGRRLRSSLRGSAGEGQESRYRGRQQTVLMLEKRSTAARVSTVNAMCTPIIPLVFRPIQKNAFLLALLPAKESPSV